ncbi:TRAP transporter large permease [Cryobacterium aureum]|uniref:TRAP transporter large permease n=1 Tax=Cryobacterium aureum TaxID=995037 RepID=UPI000CF42C79|nr:TRAP transporter large permease [Cryobacterium aureum]
MSLWILIALIAILLALRVPVGFAFLGPSLAYMIIEGNSTGLALRVAADGVSSFPLLAVPLFILLGSIANRAGIADRIFDFALAVLGRIKGNLAYVNIGTSVGFAWMSGSALADAAALGKLQVPGMVRSGYSFRFAAGLTSASSLIAPVMPPSIPAVIYASVATVSTGALFAGSVLPAMLIALGLVITVFILVRKNSNLNTIRFSWSVLGRASVRVIGPIGAPIIILGGILGGFFTPTEAAAVGVAYMIVLGLIYRTLNLRAIIDALKETAAVTGAIALILAAAALLGWILARERAPQAVADGLTSLTDNPIVFLLLVNLILIILGMVIDATAVLLITVPVLLPVAVQYGIDPIHFGVVMIVNLMIGLLTPPVGSVLYVMSSVTNRPVDEVFRGVLPFLVPLLAVLGLLTFFPQIVTIVPTLLGL